MAKTHPYILPGYQPMAIAPYDVEPTSSPVVSAIQDAEFWPVINITTEAETGQPGTALMVINHAANDDPIVEELSEGRFFANDDDPELSADIFSSSAYAAADRLKAKKKMIPATALMIGVMLSVFGYAYSPSDLGRHVASPITADRAIATPVKMTNGMPANMAPLLDVYYQPQPLETDRVVLETDANGCQWKVAFDGSVNIPKARYPALNAQNVQKCTDATRAARPQIVRVARGAEPKGKTGTSIAIVNVIDPATGMTDRQAFASFKGDVGEVSIDKASIDSIIKSELARAQKSGAAQRSAQMPQMASRSAPVQLQGSRYPGIEYRNRAPINSMPSMPGSAGAANDDKPTYIPYIPGRPYTPPQSLGGGPKPLRSIRPKIVAGGIVKREMAPQIQSAKPGGQPTELRTPVAPQLPTGNDIGAPSGSPLG